MKQHSEFVTEIQNLKEKQSTKGWLYSFSIPLTKMQEDVQLTEWLSCIIFLKERDPRIMTHQGDFHFSGTLQVKPEWNEHPQGVSLFGFQIEPVLGNIYRVTKTKAQTPQEATEPTSSTTPIPIPEFPTMSNQEPF